MKTMVVVNPSSAHGKTGRIWPLLKGPLESSTGKFDEAFTSRETGADSLTRLALEQGYERIISVGGDGTLHGCVNGFFKDGKSINPDAVLSMVMNGTGSDFRKTLSLGPDPFVFIERLKNPSETLIDIGKIFFPEKNQTRYFINIASFGMGGRVVDRMNRSRLLKKIGGKAAFYLVIIYTMLSYKNIPVNFQFNDSSFTRKIRNAAVANARFHGGGMMIAPKAFFNDSLFDIVILGDLSFFKSISLTGKIYKGSHLGSPRVESFQTRHIKITSEKPLVVEADGEVLFPLPAEFSILPGAIRIQF